MTTTREIRAEDLFPGLYPPARLLVDAEGEVTDLEVPDEPDYTTLTMVFTNHGALSTTSETATIDDVVDLEETDLVSGGVVITGTEFSGARIKITVEYPKESE